MGPISLESLTVIGLLMVLWTLGDLILVSAKLKLTRTHHHFHCSAGHYFLRSAWEFWRHWEKSGVDCILVAHTAVIAKRRQYYG